MDCITDKTQRKLVFCIFVSFLVFLLGLWKYFFVRYGRALLHLHILLRVAAVVTEIDNQLLLLYVLQLLSLLVYVLAVAGRVTFFLALGTGVVQQPGADHLQGGKIPQVVGAVVAIVAVAAVVVVAETAEVLCLLDKGTLPGVVALALLRVALRICHGFGILHAHRQVHLSDYIVHVLGVGAVMGSVTPLEAIPALDELQKRTGGVPIGIPQGVVVAHEIPLVPMEAEGAQRTLGRLLRLRLRLRLDLLHCYW